MSNASKSEQRGFCLKEASHPTAVNVSEAEDGSISIQLITERDGLEPLVTSMRLAPKTFHLLSAALARAAHDPSVWLPLLDERPVQTQTKAPDSKTGGTTE